MSKKNKNKNPSKGTFQYFTATPSQTAKWSGCLTSLKTTVTIKIQFCTTFFLHCVGCPLDVQCEMWFVKNIQLKSKVLDNKDHPPS